MAPEKVLGPAALTTDRLRIRPMAVTNVEMLFALKSDPEVTRCYGQGAHRSIDPTRERVSRNVEDQRHGAVLTGSWNRGAAERSSERAAHGTSTAAAPAPR
jgi:hypothetical protein